MGVVGGVVLRGRDWREMRDEGKRVWARWERWSRYSWVVLMAFKRMGYSTG